MSRTVLVSSFFVASLFLPSRLLAQEEPGNAVETFYRAKILSVVSSSVEEDFGERFVTQRVAGEILHG
ncbi:MAG TPA: hypothetical protein VEA18_03140, partial [Candidatus Kapabacteria bacterium]|nr:hypothetical protein [Candidatus Kapabacteria bacterium]